MNHERIAIQKIARSFLEGNGPLHCQADKDLMIKHLLQKIYALEERICRLEHEQLNRGRTPGEGG